MHPNNKIQHFLHRVIILTTLTFLLAACNYDSMNDTPDPDNCDTENVMFSTDIMPIVQANCFNGCHNGSSPLSGFSLESYAAVKAKVDEGRLYGAVAHLPGFVPMPQGGGRLPQCDIDQIKAWIDAGAPNN